MPTEGRPKLQARVSQELLERVQAQLDSITAHATMRTRMQLDLSGFVVSAIEEKLAKMARSRNWKRGSRGGVSGTPREIEGKPGHSTQPSEGTVGE